MSEVDIRDSIAPKSDQLNADDLIAGPMTVTVRQVKRGPSGEQPVEIVLDGHRPYRPCKSMRRVLVACWGDQGANWIGRSMTLYADPSVKFGGVAVGGIRISHVSHIDSDRILMLTVTRSKRSEHRVARLENRPATYPDEAFSRNLDAWVKAVVCGSMTVPDIIRRATKTGALTLEQIARLETEVASLLADAAHAEDVK